MAVVSILQTPSTKLFLGGDSGYDTIFAEIGNKYESPFDLAILECGQYSPYWKYIHMMPEETVRAGLDLRAEKILPVHWAKFSLSLNDWDDSIKRVTAEASKKKRICLFNSSNDWRRGGFKWPNEIFQDGGRSIT